VVDRHERPAADGADAPDELLAQFMRSADEWLHQQRRDVDGAKNIVNAELLARMDGRLKWTHRARLNERRRVRADVPSPNAGTTAYNVDRMAEALKPFVEDGTLSQEAYEEVVKRTVTIKVTGARHGRGSSASRRTSTAPRSAEDTSVHLPAVAKLEKLEDPRITTRSPRQRSSRRRSTRPSAR
jgi:hypothetical protein